MLLILAQVMVIEERGNDFMSAFSSYREKIVAGEPGTIAFDLYKDKVQPHAYTIIELYRDEAAYNAHLGYPWRDDALVAIRATLSKASASHHRRICPH